MASIFTDRVIKGTTNTIHDLDVLKVEIGSDSLKSKVNKILQRANRRIQNVTSKGYASPAVKAVIAERGTRDYTYFSIAGLDPTNKIDWEQIRYECGRALSFLQNPTSSATGARQYINYQAARLKIPFESANKIVDIATDPTIDEYGNVNIFSYGDILDDFKADVETAENLIDDDAENYAEQLENALLDMLSSRSGGADTLLDRFINDD